MAIDSVSGATQHIPQPVNPQQVKVSQATDGDNDGTKAGQVEKARETGKAGETGKAAEVAQASTLTSSALGTVVSTKA